MATKKEAGENPAGKEIVKAVTAKVSGKFTQEELEKLEDEYLLEAQRLMKKVGFDAQMMAPTIVLEKILSPFEYWLRNRLECEAINSSGGRQ